MNRLPDDVIGRRTPGEAAWDAGRSSIDTIGVIESKDER